jgi:type I restriction enzyme S subunit
MTQPGQRLYPDFSSKAKGWDTRPARYFLKERSVSVGKDWDKTQLLSLTKQGVIDRDIDSGVGKYPSSFEGYQLVEPGNLVFCLFDVEETPRTIGLVKNRGMITSAYTAYQVNEGVAHPRFLEYLFVSVDNGKRYRPFYSGLRNTIPKGVLLGTMFSLPPIEEQKAIADFLDNELARIDALIEKQHDLIARLKERKNALLKMMILGLGRSSSTTQMTEYEWLAGIPADWKITKICREFSLTLGKTLNAATNQGEVIVPYLRAGNVQDSGIDLQEVKTIGVTVKEMTDLALLRGDVVVVEGGAGFGRSDVLADTLDGWVFQNHVIRARSRGTVTPEYLDLYIKYLRSIGHFEKLSAYATIPSISSDALGRIPIPKPPKEVATELVQSLTNDLSKHDTLIAKSFQLIAGLQARRSALVSNAVSGQIDVRGEN